MEKITRIFDLLEQYKGMYSWKKDAFNKKNSLKLGKVILKTHKFFNFIRKMKEINY